MIVTEIGDRVATSVCGSLLAQAGATVVLVEPAVSKGTGKWKDRPAAAAGKASVRCDAGHDREFLERLLASSDVVITSSDVSPLAHRRREQQIVCDITAFGSSGALSGRAYTDAQVQAISGIADTTGDPALPPTLVGFPIVEASAGIYAAAAVLAAVEARRQGGAGQDVEVALYDCAINAIPTFLVSHFIGKSAHRVGNGHSMVSPWNAYHANDGWILVCAATEDQWANLCSVVGRAELKLDPRFRTNADRLSRRAEVDAIVQAWVEARASAACVDALLAAGIPSGPIATVEQLTDDENLVRRAMTLRLADPVSGHTKLLAGTPLKSAPDRGVAPASIPLPGADRARVEALLGPASPVQSGTVVQHPPPYAGLRVLEIGQYTTAPLVSRHLASFGADVVKIEPPSGDSARRWLPHQHGQSFFFTITNSGKRSVVLDLGHPQDQLVFQELLSSADVLVENLKPGSLARLGFAPGRLREINPRLVYCGISGFGLDSVYPGRPAFDTVVQAMSGIMDLTRVNGMPTKAGISAADILGGEIALFAVLASLAHRGRTGAGQSIDLSMQDAAFWAMRCASPLTSEPVTIVANGGGHAVAQGDEVTPILDVSAVALSAQTRERRLVQEWPDDAGHLWPLLAAPFRLSAMAPVRVRPIGALGEGDREILGRNTP